MTPKSQAAGGPDRHLGRSSCAGNVALGAKGAAVFMHRTRKRAEQGQAWLLQLGMKIGSIGSKVDHVPQEVVATNTVTASATGQRMVSETVKNAVAMGAVTVVSRQGHAKPSGKHNNVQRRFVAKLRLDAWRSLKPAARTASSDQLEVRAAGQRDMVRRELHEEAAVNSLGQLFLR